MKQKIITIFCLSIIFFSILYAAKSFFSQQKSSQNPDENDLNIESYSDPLTEAFFDNKMIDIGDVYQNTIVFQDFVLKNTGEYPLIIYYVSPDCNCTDYFLSTQVAIPGDSIVITLEVNMKNKDKGMFMLNTVLRANTSDQMYRLRLQGNLLNR